MLQFAMLLALLSLSTVSNAEPRNAEPRETISAGNSTFAFVTEDGRDYWLRRNKSYHVRSAQLYLDKGDYQVYPILLLEEHESRSHVGIEGTTSRIRLTAWKMTTSELREKLWVIEDEADAWEWQTTSIKFTKYGCCDAPDKVATYRVRDGVSLD